MTAAPKTADDTQQLITRLTTLRDGLGLFHEADAEVIDDAIAALGERLPHADAAELIARARAAAQGWRDPLPLPKVSSPIVLTGNPTAELYDDLAAALAAQAQEIERLNFILRNHGVTQLEKTEIMLAQAQEIEQLKAELRVVYKLPFAMDHPIAQKLTAEREAAEARIRELEEQAKRDGAAIDYLRRGNRDLTSELAAKEACVRELEAKQQPLQDRAIQATFAADQLQNENGKLRAELAAKEAATIERCAEAAEGIWEPRFQDQSADERQVKCVAAIRALAKEPTAAPPRSAPPAAPSARLDYPISD